MPAGVAVQRVIDAGTDLEVGHPRDSSGAVRADLKAHDDAAPTIVRMSAEPVELGDLSDLRDGAMRVFPDLGSHGVLVCRVGRHAVRRCEQLLAPGRPALRRSLPRRA